MVEAGTRQGFPMVGRSRSPPVHRIRPSSPGVETDECELGGLGASSLAPQLAYVGVGRSSDGILGRYFDGNEVIQI